ncbi:MAG: hypothetical protein B5M51_08900 [Anaerolinea sp. 4484_236]|nr:MAG: hypothetical protein B5M51_08900 [Anaerolinea sp. 4484_236]
MFILGEWTLMEINVHPWRMGKPRIAQTYETLLTHFPNLRIIDTNRDIARKAAQIRDCLGLQ